jgi:ectoine hydroxylase-related dioxygenase (phytanoyl-CoA dioxygenase family)
VNIADLQGSSPVTADRDQATVRLSEDQIAAFHRDGYLALDALTSPEEVESLRGVYDDLFGRRRDGFDDGDHLDLTTVDGEGRETLPQILNPAKYAPRLAETQARANAMAIARQLLGEEVRDAGDHAILKPPRHGAPTPWHQDEAYWNPAFAHAAVSFWMPLQEATRDNGCMQFIPGSHALDVVEHRLADADAHALETTDGAVDEDRAVACPIPAGGCTIHHCRTLHYAGPNHSDTPRRAYIMGFAAPAEKLPAPRDYHWQRPEWYA